MVMMLDMTLGKQKKSIHVNQNPKHMRSKVMTVSVKEANDVLCVWSKEEKYYAMAYAHFIEEMGLRIPSNHSYLYEIVDQKIWMLAKIKYGI